jgi:flavin-dependent dehydrogenase
LGLSFDVPNFEIREARVIYKDQSYSFFGDPVFRITRRDEFDHWLVNTAESLGVHIRQGEAVIDVTQHEDYVEVITGSVTIRAKTLVAADGSRSLVRRKLKWPGKSHVARLMEVLTPVDVTQNSLFRDGVALFDFTPMDNGLQGYYWDFPSLIGGKPFMNRGLFDSRARPEFEKADLKQILRNTLADRGINLDDFQLKGHPIRWWHRGNIFSMPRILLAGDAAGADPLVGEGISFALGYGEVAASAIADAFSRKDFSYAGYRDLLLEHPLFSQLDLRTRMARIAYKINDPWLTRSLWFVVDQGLRRSRWSNPRYKPAISPQFRLADAIQSS